EVLDAMARTLVEQRELDEPQLLRAFGLLKAMGVVAEVVFETSFPLPAETSGDALNLGLAERVEAVHEGDADVNFGGLAVGVS
ncbi:hypothetical protein SAMN05216224_12612, partial [Thioclava dalianensis]